MAGLKLRASEAEAAVEEAKGQVKMREKEMARLREDLRFAEDQVTKTKVLARALLVACLSLSFSSTLGLNCGAVGFRSGHPASSVLQRPSSTK
jgi:uncharacterized ferredoxin-like protein